MSIFLLTEKDRQYKRNIEKIARRYVVAEIMTPHKSWTKQNGMSIEFLLWIVVNRYHNQSCVRSFLRKNEKHANFDNVRLWCKYWIGWKTTKNYHQKEFKWKIKFKINSCFTELDIHFIKSFPFFHYGK